MDNSNKKIWSVGTLTYDGRQLTNVFFWLLWGDFVLTLMDTGVGQTLVGFQLEKLGASKSTIGFLNGAIGSFMSAVMVSVISTYSDRTRSRLGRRIPYMLYVAPALALVLGLTGFSPQIARWLSGSFPTVADKFTWWAQHLLPGVGALAGAAALTVGVMTALLTMYKFLDMFPQSVYYYIWPDVIPAKLMATFACLFRVVASFGMFVFNRYLLKYADTHPEWLFIGAGALYLFSFIALAMMVKEGEYDPPPPKAQGNVLRRSISAIQSYFVTCFGHSYYVKYYAMNMCFIIAVKSIDMFIPFYGTSGMGFTKQRYGELISYKDLVMIIPLLLLGPIVDRLHPLRAGLWAYGFVVVAGAASFLFISGETSFAVLMTATYCSISIYRAATGAIGPRLLPRQMYGQFASAGAVVFNLAWAGCSWICGKFLDIVTDLDPATGVARHPENYRYIMLWFTLWAMAGVFLTVSVYRHWKQLGGDEAYEPPMPNRGITPAAGT